MRIAIQGFEGSFHQIAAQEYFHSRQLEILPCSTFSDVVRKVHRREVDRGVMAIENSLAGSILPNYQLLQRYELTIIGEIYLNIRQHLMMLPEYDLDDIREVHSHPMALLQCAEFLEKHPEWKLVETEDTALSARHLRQYRARHVAAIASKLAAEIYQLKIVAPNIHTMKKNYTRFLILSHDKQTNLPDGVNKSSISFQTDHTRGSLARVLVKIADGGINLSKLQSHPVPGSEWRYYFYVDMEFDHFSQFEAVIRDIEPLTRDLKILGVYQKGQTI
ncbi:MAG: prephenate dehydratase [Thermoflavifilum aggregans]|nr:prephenate dehydratase [Thermoflavifilum aggregans]